MKFCIVVIAVLFTFSKGRSQEKVCPYEGVPVAIVKYDSGMTFFFPATSPRMQSNTVLTEFLRHGTDTNGQPTLVVTKYKDIAGQYLRMVAIDSFEMKSYFGGNYWKYIFTLANITRRDTFEYDIVVDRRLFARGKLKKSPAGDYVIREGIYMAELQEAQRELVKDTIYTKFAFNGKMFEPVTVTRVTEGTWETPLRIHIKSSSGQDSSVDVNITGTNVLGAFIDRFHFSVFFTCTNPLSPFPKTHWSMLQQGRPALAMSSEEVILILGRPQKISDTETPGEKSTVYSYSNYTLSFKSNFLIKIEASK